MQAEFMILNTLYNAEFDCPLHVLVQRSHCNTAKCMHANLILWLLAVCTPPLLHCCWTHRCKQYPRCHSHKLPLYHEESWRRYWPSEHLHCCIDLLVYRHDVTIDKWYMQEVNGTITLRLHWFQQTNKQACNCYRQLHLAVLTLLTTLTVLHWTVNTL